MIAACPKCRSRYRVDPARLTPEGLRLRCSQCQAVFRVRAPGAAGSPPAARTAPAAREATAPTPGAPASPAAPPEADRRRKVLVADPDPERAKAVAGALESWGLEVCCAHDGVEALLTLQRELPRAAVLDAALPRMYGFEICELVKRNESLRSTWIVLVGAVDDPARHRRAPSELYGADAYVERPELPHALAAVLRGFGMPLREPGAAPAASAAPAAGVAPQAVADAASAPPAARSAPAAPAAATPATSAAPQPASTEDHAQAERLARIIVSDIVLYNQEAFESALGGDVVAALADQVEEGRALLRQRVGEAVAGARDFVADELRRVARQRGGA